MPSTMCIASHRTMMRHIVLLPLVCTALLSTSTLATSDEFHLHRVDAVHDKCFEASSRSQFANKHLPDTGKCPSSYNTVDELVTILQCPDGVTSIRDCSPINVTIATKAGTHQLRSMVDDDRCGVNSTIPTSPCVRGNYATNDTAKCILNGCPCEHGYVNTGRHAVAWTCADVLGVFADMIAFQVHAFQEHARRCPWVQPTARKGV